MSVFSLIHKGKGAVYATSENFSYHNTSGGEVVILLFTTCQLGYVANVTNTVGYVWQILNSDDSILKVYMCTVPNASNASINIILSTSCTVVYDYLVFSKEFMIGQAQGIAQIINSVRASDTSPTSEFSTNTGCRGGRIYSYILDTSGTSIPLIGSEMTSEQTNSGGYHHVEIGYIDTDNFEYVNLDWSNLDTWYRIDIFLSDGILFTGYEAIVDDRVLEDITTPTQKGSLDIAEFQKLYSNSFYLNSQISNYLVRPKFLFIPCPKVVSTYVVENILPTNVTINRFIENIEMLRQYYAPTYPAIAAMSPLYYAWRSSPTAPRITWRDVNKWAATLNAINLRDE